jgi:HPt (histidine-containing phosphotransfer) domain-containing protein
LIHGLSGHGAYAELADLFPVAVRVKVAGRSVMRDVNQIVRPLVDESFVQRTRFKLTTVFVDQFVESLPGRLGRLRLALTTGDRDGALEVIATLRSSGHAVGAEQLAVLLEDLEHELRAQTAEANSAVVLSKLAAAYLPALHHCGHKTVDKLNTLPRH